MNALEIKNVTYSYGDRKALKGINLNIKIGSLFCLLGPNGGGKSTLLNILSTLESPETGSVTYFEKKENIRADIGVVFQNPALDKKLSVAENLRHHGKLYSISNQVLEKRIDELLNFMGLSDRRDEKTENLSGGLKRRVEIAKSLIHKPKLLILDEPTTGLDPLVRKEIWRDLKRQQELDKTTIVFTTHLLEEADAADRVAMIDQGLLVAEGTPSELKSMVGNELVSLKCQDPKNISSKIESVLGIKPVIIENEVRLQSDSSRALIDTLVSTFRDQFDTLTLGKPTLEDLFLLKTGRKIGDLT